MWLVGATPTFQNRFQTQLFITLVGRLPMGRESIERHPWFCRWKLGPGVCSKEERAQPSVVRWLGIWEPSIYRKLFVICYEWGKIWGPNTQLEDHTDSHHLGRRTTASETLGNISEPLPWNWTLSSAQTIELNATSQRGATDRSNLAASSFSFFARG